MAARVRGPWRRRRPRLIAVGGQLFLNAADEGFGHAGDMSSTQVSARTVAGRAMVPVTVAATTSGRIASSVRVLDIKGIFPIAEEVAPQGGFDINR